MLSSPVLRNQDFNFFLNLLNIKGYRYIFKQEGMRCDMHKEEKNPHISEVQECNLLLAIDTVTSQQNIPINDEE